jgi:hypothetical protein
MTGAAPRLTVARAAPAPAPLRPPPNVTPAIPDLGNQEMQAMIRGNVVRMQPDPLGPDLPPVDQIDWLAALRVRLQDGRTDDALAAIRAMTPPQVNNFLANPGLRSLAVKQFDKDEMGQAVVALHGEAVLSLQLLWAEGCDWDQVRPFLLSSPPGLAAVLPDDAMMAGFVDALGDKEMAIALLMLPGPLARKIEWLRAEDTGYDEAVTVIDGAPAEERPSLYDRDDLLHWFVKICDDQDMRNIVRHLGGTLRQQLHWLNAEGTNFMLLADVIVSAPKEQRAGLLDDPQVQALLKDNLNDDELKWALDLIGGPLSQQVEILQENNDSNAPEAAEQPPALSERDVQLLNQLEGRGPLLTKYEEYERASKAATAYVDLGAGEPGERAARASAALMGLPSYRDMLNKQRDAAREALNAELAAQGFVGPPEVQLAIFLDEIRRFEAMFLGFGLQTAFAMLNDNTRIAEQEGERYKGEDGMALIRMINANLDRFDIVAIGVTWSGVAPLARHNAAFPILAHPAFYTLDMVRMAQAGDVAAIAAHARSVADGVIENVGKTREDLRGDTDKLWQLEGVIAQANQLLGIAEGSVYDRLVKRKLAEIKENESFRTIALAALAIGLGLLTGGLGTLAVVASAGVAAISVAGAVQSWRRYSFTSAAHGSAIDPTRALTQVDPSQLWLAVDILGAFLDLGAFAGAVKALRAPAEALVLTGEAADTSRRALEQRAHDLASSELQVGRDIVSEEKFVADVVSSTERHASQQAILKNDKALATEVRAALTDRKLAHLAEDDATVAGLVSLGEDTARSVLRGFGNEPELLGRLATLAGAEPAMAKGLNRLRTAMKDEAFKNVMRDVLLRRDPGRANLLVAAAADERLTAEQMERIAKSGIEADPAARARAVETELNRSLKESTGLAAPGSQAERDVLETTRSLDAAAINNPSAQLADELAYVEHSHALPINEGDYVAEVALPNGHSWRRNRAGKWCRFSNGAFCLADEGLTTISGRVTRAERIGQTVAPLDWPIYRIDPAHAPDIVPPGVVLEFPDGERVFRSAGEEGGIVIESVLGKPRARKNFERQYYRRGEMPAPYGKSTAELSHSQGAGLKFESPYAIPLAPRQVNQTLQNTGIEEFLRTLERAKQMSVKVKGVEQFPFKDVVYHQVTNTKMYPLSRNLRQIEYRIDVAQGGVRRRGFEVEINVSDAIVNPHVTIGSGFVSDELAPFLSAVDLPDSMRERLALILQRRWRR